MEGRSYFELTSHLAALNEALHGEPDYLSQIELMSLIEEAKKRIDNYDLSDDDLFKCASCSQVFDNDDSNHVGGELHCDSCMVPEQTDDVCGAIR